MNDGIPMNSGQSSHIKSAADIFPAAPDTGLSGEFSGDEVIRSNADQSGDLQGHGKFYRRRIELTD
jgi:hypothetical protein